MIELVSKAEMARRLGVSPERVRSWVVDGHEGSEFPEPVGRTPQADLWDWSTVERWAEQIDVGRGAIPPAARSGAAPTFSPVVPSSAPAATEGDADLVGRDLDIKEIRSLLQSNRLVTLVGPPGVGKTRLAAAIAKASSEVWADGARLIPIASLADPRRVMPGKTSSGTNDGEGSARIVNEGLVAGALGKRMLFVLDGCEHLMPECAEFIESVLKQGTDTRVLATSRSAFGIPSERVELVRPLAVASCGCCVESDASRLFRARAGVDIPDSPIVNEAINAICRRLDGIPLAIELAASWATVLTPLQIADRLGGGSGLAGDTRPGLPQQDALYEAIDGSYELLDDDERTLFRRVSVFAGSCAIDAVEAVCAGDGLEQEKIIQTLASLVRRSLVVASTDTEPEARYQLLETVRDFAHQRLMATNELSATRERHWLWCSALVEAAEPQLTGSGQADWFRRLELEHDNLRLALRGLLDDGRGRDALAMAAALPAFWRMHGHLAEGHTWLSEALEAASDAPDLLRAKGLLGLGLLATMAGYAQPGFEALEACRDMAHAEGDASLEARAFLCLGGAARMRGDEDGAVVALSKATELARSADDRCTLAHSLAVTAEADLARGEFLAARPFAEESLATARASGDLQSLILATTSLGGCLLHLGQFHSAGELLTEGFQVARSVGGHLSAAVVSRLLGVLASGRGKYDEALELLRYSLSTAIGVGHVSGVLLAHCALGRLAFVRADLKAAQAWFDEAAALADRTNYSSSQIPWGMGEVALATGNPARARELFDAALLAATAHRQRSVSDAVRFALARTAARDGDLRGASSMHHEVLVAQHRAGEMPAVVRSLDELGGVAVALEHFERGVRLMGAADALRQRNDYALHPVEESDRQKHVETARQGLGDDRFEERWSQGAALSVDDAVSYACRRQGRKSRDRPPAGWSSLTKSERRVVELVAEGLTNAQAAERLFVSIRTVTSHLYEVYSKLGINSRTELVRQVMERGNGS